MLLDFNSLIRVILAALLSLVLIPATAEAGGRVRGLLQRPLVRAAGAQALGFADGVLASRGAPVSVSQIAQQLPLRNRMGGGYAAAASYESYMPVAEAAPYAAPIMQPAAVPAAPQYTTAQAAAAFMGGADLVLEDVSMADHATLVAGPAYAVRWRNQGSQATGNFHVALVASQDGSIQADSPRVVMEVGGLYPGAMQELVLRLPRCEFNYLIVLVDAGSDINELNEQNNAAVLERSTIR